MGSAQPQLQTRDSHSVIANSSEDPEQAQLQSLESIIGEFDTMMAEATVEDEEQEEYKGNLSVDYQKWFFDDHLTVNVKKNVTNPLSTPPANLNANLTRKTDSFKYRALYHATYPMKSVAKWPTALPLVVNL